MSRHPILPLERAHALGFVSVGFVMTGLYAAARALQQAYRHLLEHGSSQGLEDRMMSFEEFGQVVGLEGRYALDERFAAGEPGEARWLLPERLRGRLAADTARAGVPTGRG